ncbi:TetR/AcrR family transcriptional regulator [Marinobacter sp. NFXS9]|uniref:TetR/AcrR family transcriptional regulator n=1 Tax=Marinobacter sp. NFXS9 TaxID=2818433 RepID=UPI0032DFDE8B
MLDTASLGKRERNRLNNRKAILDAARDCFRETGYEQTTIRDIIRRTPLASGTFYNYFSDKRDIFIALFRDFLEALRTLIRSAHDTASDEHDLIHRMYSSLFLAAAKDPVTYELAHRNSQAVRELFGSDILDLAMASMDTHIRSLAANDRLPGQDSDYISAACRGVAYEVSLRVAERARQRPQMADEEARRATEFVVGFLYSNPFDGSKHQRRRA